MRDSKRSTQSFRSFQDNNSRWTKKVPLKYHEEKGEKRETVTFQVTIAGERLEKVSKCTKKKIMNNCYEQSGILKTS